MIRQRDAYFCLLLFCLLLFAYLLHPVFVQASDTAADSQGFDFKLPLASPAMSGPTSFPKDNPLTTEKVGVGPRVVFR